MTALFRKVPAQLPNLTKLIEDCKKKFLFLVHSKIYFRKNYWINWRLLVWVIILTQKCSGPGSSPTQSRRIRHSLMDGINLPFAQLFATLSHAKIHPVRVILRPTVVMFGDIWLDIDRSTGVFVMWITRVIALTVFILFFATSGAIWILHSTFTQNLNSYNKSYTTKFFRYRRPVFLYPNKKT